MGRGNYHLWIDNPRPPSDELAAIAAMALLGP